MLSAIEAMEKLLGWQGDEVYILSAPSVKYPYSYSEKREWVEIHFGEAVCERQVLSGHKRLTRGDFLINDQLFGKGQEYFGGK